MTDLTPIAGAAPKPRRRWLGLLVLLTVLGVGALVAWRKHRRVPPPPSLPPATSGPLVGLRLAPAFKGVRFERPVFVTPAPGDVERLYVVEQAGVIRRFVAKPDVSESEVFLDIRARVSTSGNEEGLLGLAFHPKYPNDPRVFVYYSSNEGGPLLGGRSIVSTFKVSDGLADPASEAQLLEVEQPYRNHNGGMIAFGPDGKLYVGLGDGGLAGDPGENGLNKGTLLGSILRLDVDVQGRPYGIPDDNPFVGEEGARGEVWAYGLRNPWRFSFDRETGELWAGDVGQNAWEEVDLIERGGNYGWRAYEGFADYDSGSRARAKDAIEPLAAYGRGEGFSITGGYVYRGSRIPALRGHYVYADFGTGAVWALSRGAKGAPAPEQHPVAKGVVVTKLMTSGRSIASFGEAPDGELYACSFDGWIYQLVGPDS